ncbi:uncharacterized protein BX664DRAFT_321684 [Halteromyces radiatus]|uniref:uncharacterized protein n=1 Tax=Halteromyces radiatus TaxID=101107 RepID=UPI0022207E3B|nr:uncharacterized protein BX664DRAFT_321684 [Halteromyces radiatus]KAI8099597.1 hypothetical protein BX664DRAFT_321684 [Halteromyces radiatus]
MSSLDDQVRSYGQNVSNQNNALTENNGTFVNQGYMNAAQRIPPGFMLPSPEYQPAIKLGPNMPLLPGNFSMGDAPRPPPSLAPSFSTGTTGSQYHHPRPMLSPPPFLSNNNNNYGMPSFPIFPPPPHPSMFINNNNDSIMLPPPPPPPHQHHFIPPSLPQHSFIPQMHPFPSQFHHQPLVGDLNK